ncbi:Peptidoglycan/LPS O-acetylase OafA/YrhL, contains acyltransferase and SGNH-hydrolase domains [Nonomuraea solani]|uniref:Peptidoglycan/LPS O-acetylase OafA/YrhL, contains acyltransferase and SGNH-hydrolase domains n=1 Tax=Nonomuraea solani TaxID=1144553 RepID=A0A1H6E8V7_9ACTN|nr:acyltransferase [Nonomuraea solani]SEG93374.1 Peptidoglycan/LPS O-acetylase OafA/YrhL, contains acyltransferase and SGNH-hydrolase domains [Nonomuraea solani]
MRVKSERLYEIDGLRLLAALFVVLFHYLFSGWANGKTNVTFVAESAWAKYGYLGVDLFFLISGFVVLMSAWGRTPRQFVVSRVVRLYPAYWVGLAVTAVVTVTLGQKLFSVTLPQVLANLTMFQAVPNIDNVDVVYWTLWAEMRFYFLILALTFIGMTKGRVMAALWGWLALTFLVQFGILPGKADLIVQSEFSHYFIAGMALFMFYRFGLNWQIALLVPICLGNAVYRAIGFSESVGNRYSVTYSPVIITAVVVLIFLVMTFVALRVTRPLARPGMVAAGALTYPLYLLHAHVGFILLARLEGTVNKYVLVVGLILVMLGAAYLVHRFVERPLAPRIKRLLSKREPVESKQPVGSPTG